MELEDMKMELDKDKILTCEICEEYQGTAAQLRGHKPRCKGKIPTIIEDKVPETKPEIQVKPRRERTPFGVPQPRLPNVPKNDGFQYRLVNDNWAKDPNRIKRAEQGGYEIYNEVKPFPVGTNDDGTPIMGTVMRIPQEWYDEDQKIKQREVDKVDKAIKTGKIEEQEGDNRYIPQGIKIHSSNNING